MDGWKHWNNCHMKLLFIRKNKSEIVLLNRNYNMIYIKPLSSFITPHTYDTFLCQRECETSGCCFGFYAVMCCCTARNVFGLILPELVSCFISRKDSSHRAAEADNSHRTKWAPGQRFLWSHYPLVKKLSRSQSLFLSLSVPFNPSSLLTLLSFLPLKMFPRDQVSACHIFIIMTDKLFLPWEY